MTFIDFLILNGILNCHQGCPVFNRALQCRQSMPETRTLVTPDTRSDGRLARQLRPIRFQNHIAPHATGSTLIEWGSTRVICGVTVEDNVPR